MEPKLEAKQEEFRMEAKLIRVQAREKNRTS